MAFVNMRDSRMYYGGYEPGSGMTKVLIAIGRVPLDTTVIGNAGENAIAGIRQDKAEYAGLFDLGSSMDAAQAALLGTGTHVLTVTFGTGTSTANIAYSGVAALFDAPPGGAVKDIVRQEAVLQVVGSGFERTHILAIRGTATGSGASGTVDNGTITAGGGTLYIHVFSVTGTGNNGTITLQDSANGTAWSAVGTLLFVAATATSTAIGTTGTLRRYRRVIHGLQLGVTAFEYAVTLSGRTN